MVVFWMFWLTVGVLAGHALWKRPMEMWPYAVFLGVCALAHAVWVWGLAALVLVFVGMSLVVLGLLVAISWPGRSNQGGVKPKG